MAKKIEKVLVPLDFSRVAENAYEFAREQGWDIMVIHVLEESMLEKIYPWMSKPGLDLEKFVEEMKKVEERSTMR